MPIQPQAAKYKPESPILSLGEKIGDPVHAADFPKAILRFRNDRWAEAVGLDHLNDDQWVQHFGRFQPLEGTLQQPLALRYHGHQFRVYNPDIGDGRGFLFAQLRDHAGRLLDLGTKGSGQTPYSRFGDGRLTLKGGVREILATEMLEALGVNSSKTFSLVETGEDLIRGDEPSPTRSSVLVRLSHSHIRIGTFQRIALEQNSELMTRLVDYCLTNLLQPAPEGVAPPIALMRQAVENTAELAASFMVAGFVHGVLNSDNINITGESFDYGPWRFTPHWEPGFTAAYFDQTGLYAFGRQAEAIHWDVAQLAVSLRLLCEAEPLIAELEHFPALYQDSLITHFFRRIGLTPGEREASLQFIESCVQAMAQTGTEIDRFFFDWRCGDPRSPARYAGEAWDKVRMEAAAFLPAGTRDHPYWTDDAPCSMHIEEVEALWSAIADRDDWEPLNQKVEAIRRMGEAHQPRLT
ncbi:protein adenylyltransferase SelO family protein [Rhizorhapis sp.]|uniref:protein adenylyltransferase SelO family protein n=1 Tax=Rhizorhapis sp. TaxID=1968842 RepID=UPI002B47369A|nr:YdiU family protein [Rhizorhapis sp.]HKR16971.1 YdiU family protein [Rhizorhapis sp.]